MEDPDDAAFAGVDRREAHAKQRDRYRVVLIAGKVWGSKPNWSARRSPRRSAARGNSWISGWAVTARAASTRCSPSAAGRGTSSSPPQEQQQLCAMLDAGPAPEEGLAAYNGPILREKIQGHFGKLYSLAASTGCCIAWDTTT